MAEGDGVWERVYEIVYDMESRCGWLDFQRGASIRLENDFTSWGGSS